MNQDNSYILELIHIKQSQKVIEILKTEKEFDYDLLLLGAVSMGDIVITEFSIEKK
jgi:hypothetical protein